MCFRFNFSVIFLLVLFVASGCATAPTVQVLDPTHVATAKRFLQNIGAGELAMTSFKRELEKKSEEQPGMTGLLQRAFVDIDKNYFEDLIAETYSRHVTHKDLIEIAQFSESPTIKRFFNVVFEGVLSGEPVSGENIMSQFNADELTEIMKLSMSESFIRMKESLPEINREMSQLSRKLGGDIVREYIKTQ